MPSTLILAETVLDTRPSFELAAWFVTWAAVALLAVVAASLHARLRRLESGRSPGEASQPFHQLVGRPLGAPAPETVLFLSSSCPACARILEDLGRGSWEGPLGLAWTDRTPSPPPALPGDVVILEEGHGLSAGLGLRVTPFALLVDRDGTITRAAPVGSLEALGELAGVRVRRSAASPYPRLIKKEVGS